MSATPTPSNKQDASSPFTPQEQAAIQMARRWDARHANLDRPPWPSHFGDLNDEMRLAWTVLSLAKKIESNER